jgi:dienelactone hydrolase
MLALRLLHYICLIVILLYSPFIEARSTPNKAIAIFLYKPTGQFQVGFEDFHWINSHICPDPTAPSDKKAYFSQGNKRFCRELMTRIYYPAKPTSDDISPYPAAPTTALDEVLQTIKQPPQVAQAEICRQQLSQIRINAKAHLPYLKQSFPVILFSPGAIDNAEENTSTLINLASHGYIVVAINGAFLTPLTFPDDRTVPANTDLPTARLITTLYRMKLVDLNFVYEKILHEHSHKQDSIFRYMDITHLGLLGHSAGGSAVIAMTRTRPGKIAATVALDAPNQTDPKINLLLKQAHITFPSAFDIFDGFNTPVMQIHSSYASTFLSAPSKAFTLLPNNFLVTIQSTPHNSNYFKHMDYTDYALLKDLPCMKQLSAYYSQSHLDNPLFPDMLFGTISGKAALDTENTYLLSFYNTYLLSKKNEAFKQCQSLTSNTVLTCGK